jgi:xanthine dehydrogenase accessory factor
LWITRVGAARAEGAYLSEEARDRETKDGAQAVAAKAEDQTSGMEAPVAAALRWHDLGIPAALATVLKTWGSSPRRAGSQLAINDARAFVGSVSGGCIEGAVIESAKGVMADGQARTLEFGVTDDQAWSVGLACGGQVAIYLEAVQPADAELLRQLVHDAEQRRGAVVATWLSSRRRVLLHPLEEGGDIAGAVDASSGRPSGILPEVLSAAREAVTRDRSTVIETPEGEVFLHVHNPPLRLVVIGAVHITQSLAPMAALAGFDVTVIDPRSAFAADARFPGVKLDGRWPDDALAGAQLDPRTAVVTLSHDPKLDDPALEAALASKAFYIGALGSRKSHAKRVARLAEKGFGEQDVARIHAPVGLNIGSVTPAEIAVAVLAEMVGALRRGDDAAA